mmetsp:Transcript_58569/g.128592  ORF Transcript_58569/g.128592 Transcript_58569/m.128592 type:complete len:318 (+) Transcript_58569:336-1289(+)
MLLQRLPSLLEEGRVELAAHCLDQVEAWVASKAAPSSDLAWALEQLAPGGALAAVAASVRHQAARLEKVRDAFRSDMGWISRGSAYGFRVVTQGSGAYGELLSLRVEGTVEAPLFDLLLLLYEVELWATWVPNLVGMGLRTASFVAKAGPLREIVHITTKLPFPLQDRDLAFAAEVVDCMDDVGRGGRRQLIILLDSEEAHVHFPGECVELIPDSGPNKRIALKDSAILISPLQVAPGEVARTELQVLLTAKVDVAMPVWLLNLAINTLSCLVLYCLCKQAEQIHSTPLYHKRLEQHDHPFYAVMCPRVAPGVIGSE